MSFDEKYSERFKYIIKPAIERLDLQAIRVDIDKSGDSILTEIMDGIAHSRLVLADVSVIMEDHDWKPIRNGNVMYEVGIALACRQPSEVLIVRDDDKPLLFDTSTIPHETIDFTAPEGAANELQALIADRLSEQEFKKDARVKMAVQTLTVREMDLLKRMVKNIEDTKALYAKLEEDFEEENVAVTYMVQNYGWFSDAIARLLDKQLITWGAGGGQIVGYSLTGFGKAVVSYLGERLKD